MSLEQTDVETAEAALHAAKTLYRLADLAAGKGDQKEADRLLDQAMWFDGLADRLSDRHVEEE